MDVDPTVSALIEIKGGDLARSYRLLVHSDHHIGRDSPFDLIAGADAHLGFPKSLVQSNVADIMLNGHFSNGSKPAVDASLQAGPVYSQGQTLR